MDIKKRLAKTIHESLNLDITQISQQDIEDIIEVPKKRELGDFSLPCFFFSKIYGRSPQELADDFAHKIDAQYISEIDTMGPYINFFIAEEVRGVIILDILDKKQAYGTHRRAKPERILIESPGPNTNKPLHIGHLRNMVLGDALKKVLQANGHEVIGVNINNDRGVHICKSMLAYKKFGNNAEPDRKPDHFVGYWYVLYGKKLKEHPEFEEETQKMLQKWEQGDAHVRKLWEKMNAWAYEGFKETYKSLGFKVDKEYYESQTYEEGKKYVYEGLKKGVFKKDETGMIVVNLEKYNMGIKTLIRSDKTALYITQDIALAQMRQRDFNPDRMIYVVASEQNLQFQQIFKILELLGVSFAKKCYHLSYGMIKLPHGNMKSREGTVVDTDELVEEMIQEAKVEILKREPSLHKEELEKRAKIIALGAIKFFILKYDPVKDFIFDKKKSISFEGATGAYVQYAYVRIKAMLKKEKYDMQHVDVAKLTQDTERLLVNILGEYPQVMAQAAEQYKPSLIANYLIQLCQTFSNFYNDVPVLATRDETIRNSRLALIEATSIVIQNGLGVLGIKVPQKM